MLDSHNGVEKPDAVDSKIAYLEKLLELRKESQNETEFVEAVRAAFPNHKGERMLMATAKNLYK